MDDKDKSNSKEALISNFNKESDLELELSEYN